MVLGVLIVDMQQNFLQVHSKSSVEDIIKSQKKVLDRCCVDDIPVAVLECTGCEEDRPTHPELQKELKKIKRHDLFYKTKENGFSNTKLNPRLI